MNHSLSRRTFLEIAAAGAAGMTLRPLEVLGGASSSASFNVAMQGYSLKEFNLPSLVSVAEEMGIDHLELFDRQFSVFLSQRDRDRVQRELEAAGVTVPATYTDSFTNDEALAREIFEFGQQMGLRFFSCTPDENTLGLLNRLVPEYEIGVALHNPGPGPDESFVELETVVATLERFEHVGACVDVGNFARAGVDPVRALGRLKGQIHELHLKDVTTDGAYTLLGDGVVDLDALFVQLREMDFEGLVTLEYGAYPNRIDTRLKNLQANVKRLQARVE